MAAALASPLLNNLLSLGSYAQDLYERCDQAPLEFQEAGVELMALKTALSHLDTLTQSPLFVASGGSSAGSVKNETVSAHSTGSSVNAARMVEGGASKLQIEGKGNVVQDPESGKEADKQVSKANGKENMEVAKLNGKENMEVSKSNGTTMSTPSEASEASTPDSTVNILSEKTRNDMAQITAGCRTVLKSFESLLEEHRGMADLPTRPSGGGGIVSLFVGRPSGVYDRYRFAQEVPQKVNAIRAKLTYHTGAITLMLTVLGSSSLGRIEGSLSKMESMLAAAAEERERVVQSGPNNVNYYVTAHQNNQYLSPEQQEYFRQQQYIAGGMAMGGDPMGMHMHRGQLQYQNVSEQQYFSPYNAGVTGMRGGGSNGEGANRPKLLKAKGESHPGGFWGGGHVGGEENEFFANMNSWSAQPKTSSKMPSKDKVPVRPKHKDRESSILGGFGMPMRASTFPAMPVAEGKGKKKRDSTTEEPEPPRRSKTSKPQAFMLPTNASKSKYTMSGGKGESEKDKEKEKEKEKHKSSSSKVKETTKKRDKSGEKEEKVKKPKKKASDEKPLGEAKITELDDDEEAEAPKEEKEGGDVSATTENEGEKPEVAEDGGDIQPDEAKPEDVAEASGDAKSSEDTPEDPTGSSKSVKSVNSKTSKASKRNTKEEPEVADENVDKERKHRKKKEKEREGKEREGKDKDKVHSSTSKKESRPKPITRANTMPVTAVEEKKRYGGVWGELAGWVGVGGPGAAAVPPPVAEKEKKRSTSKPIAVPRKKTSAVSLRQTSRGIDGKVKSKSKSSSSATTEEERERRRQRKEKKKKEQEMNDIVEEEVVETPVAEEGVAGAAPEEKKEDQPATEEAPTAEVAAPVEENKDEGTGEGQTSPPKTAEDGEAAGETPEDEKEKKERRRKRKEAKEAKEAEEKEGEKKHRSSHRHSKAVEKGASEKDAKEKEPKEGSHHHHHHHHHKSSKDRPEASNSKTSIEKERKSEKEKDEKEKKSEKHKDKDNERPEKLKRRDSSKPEKEKEKKSSRSSAAVDKRGTVYDYDEDQQESRKKTKSRGLEAPSSPSATSSPWSKKAALGLVRLTMGGQRVEEARKKAK